MRLRWVFGLLLMWGGRVCAEGIDLYQISIVVPVPQNPKETQTALREAFLSELVRVSGQPAARQNKMILSKADKADAYIDRYFYSHTQSSSVDDPQKIPNTQLNVTFAPRLINGLLNEAKFSAWTIDRPLLMVLTKEEDGSFASRGDPKTISRQIQASFDERGVLYVLPTMDADDLLVLGAVFVSPSADQLALLQERYHYQALLIGEVTHHDKEANGSWSGQWQLVINHNTIPMDQTDQSAQLVIQQTAEQVNTVLAATAKQAATVANKWHEVMVSIQEVQGDVEYQVVRSYLEKLVGAEHVKFISTQDNTVVFQVTGKANWEKAIAVDSVLLPDVAHPNTETQFFYSFNRVY